MDKIIIDGKCYKIIDKWNSGYEGYKFVLIKRIPNWTGINKAKKISKKDIRLGAHNFETLGNNNKDIYNFWIRTKVLIG